MDNFLQDTVFAHGFDHSTMAALSSAVAFWGLCATGFMVVSCYRLRWRLRHWMTIGRTDRVDTALNFGLLLIFLVITAQRAIATYLFATGNWPKTSVAVTFSPIPLILSAIGISLFLCWASFVFDPDRSHQWWGLCMAFGIVTFLVADKFVF
jgi:hypothetical protein